MTCMGKFLTFPTVSLKDNLTADNLMKSNMGFANLTNGQSDES